MRQRHGCRYVPQVPSPTTLLVFSGAALVLLLIPGPAVLYIVARGVSQGRRAALVSVAGIHLGTVVHIVAAVIGLSALLVASATAFTVVKLAGAAYLVWLGITALRRASHDTDDHSAASAGAHRSLRRVFVDGVVLNILNPKTAVFFLAFVPQFVDAGAGGATVQIVWLGALFIVLGMVTDGLYAVGAGWVGGRIRSSARLRRRTDRAAGVTYLGLGAITALAGD